MKIPGLLLCPRFTQKLEQLLECDKSRAWTAVTVTVVTVVVIIVVTVAVTPISLPPLLHLCTTDAAIALLRTANRPQNRR